LQALESKHLQLLTAFGDELEQVTDLFHYNKDAPMLPKNAAKHSGSVKWVRGLHERIEAPMDKIKALNKSVLESEEGCAILEGQCALVNAMQQYEQLHIDAWISQVSKVSPAILY
jgi:Dynein heavy chain, N-terminal region 1